MNIIKTYAISIAAALGAVIITPGVYAVTDETSGCYGTLKQGTKFVCMYRGFDYSYNQMKKTDDCVVKYIKTQPAIGDYETHLNQSDETVDQSVTQHITFSVEMDGKLDKSLTDEKIKAVSKQVSDDLERCMPQNYAN